MDMSPAKKLDFKPTNNGVVKAVPLVGLPDLPNDDEDTTKEDNDDEPLLRENPNRFVLFPIKFHEVCLKDASATRSFINTL